MNIKEKEQIEFEKKISYNLAKGFNAFFQNFDCFKGFFTELVFHFINNNYYKSIN